MYLYKCTCYLVLTWVWQTVHANTLIWCSVENFYPVIPYQVSCNTLYN